MLRVARDHPLAREAVARLQAGGKDSRGDKAFAVVAGLAAPKAGKRSKYGAVRTLADGIWFHSAKEAKRWMQLKLLLRAGKIAELRRQVPYALTVEGETATRYLADFVYRDLATGLLVVEDVKSVVTARIGEYRLKKRLMKLIHNIDIREV